MPPPPPSPTPADPSAHLSVCSITLVVLGVSLYGWLLLVTHNSNWVVPGHLQLTPVCFHSSKPHLKSVLSHHRWLPICSHVCLLLASLCNCVRSMRTGTLTVTFSTVFLELRAERSTYSVQEMIFKGRLKTSILYSTSRIQF